MTRGEEELQAHARCHRFGQKKEVTVTTYFAPRSVESRTLGLRADVVHLENERRHAAIRRAQDNELIDLVDSDEEEQENDSDEEEQADDSEDDDFSVRDGNRQMDVEEDVEDAAVGDFEKAKSEARRGLYLCGIINTL